MTRKSILVVISKEEDWWIYPALEQIARDLPVKIAGLIRQGNTAFKTSNALETYFFFEDPRMVGYLPNLENIFENVGLILSTDNYSMSSFQVCRLASKYSIPFMVLYSGVQFQFSDAKLTSRSIKFDINLHAQKFIAMSERSKNILIEEGVEESRILTISPSVAAIKPAGSEARFRNYLDISPERDIIVYHDSLEVGRSNESVIDAAKLAQSGKYGLRSPIWILAGSGSNATNLKLKASRLELKGTTLFLEQDVRPFVNDLLAAADFYIPALIEDHDRLVPFLGYAQQAFMAGAQVVLSAHGHQAEILKEVNIRANGTRPETLMACINTLATLKNIDSTPARLRDQLTAEGETARLTLKVFLESHIQNQPPINSLEKTLKDIEELIPKGQYLDASTRLDDAMLKRGITNKQKGKIWTLKGHLDVAMGDFDKGFGCYEEALSYDETCSDAYAGLGVISLRSRASDEALTFFGKAHAIDPTKQNVAVGMANACADGGLLTEAIWWIEKALGMPGSDFQTTAAVNRIASIIPDRKSARIFLERVHETVGDHPSILMGLGRAYIEEGKYEKGNNLIKLALDKTAA